MANEARYSIREVAELVGTTVRTVRYYIEKDLIARPLGRGRGKHFSDLHVRQLKRILRLKQLGIGLKEFNASPKRLATVLEERGIDASLAKRLLGDADEQARSVNRFFRAREGERIEGYEGATKEAIRLKIADGLELHIAQDRELPSARALADLALTIRAAFGLGKGKKKR